MSSLSQAGKSALSNEVNRAFTKGLYGIDPNQLQKKEIQKRLYQQELKKQAQEQQRRKAAEKAREKLEDEKLQKKIEMDILKEKQEKEKITKPQKNQTNFSSNNNNTTKVPPPNNFPQQSSSNARKNYFSPSQQNPITNKIPYSSLPQISVYKASQPQDNYPLYSSINPPNSQLPYSYVPRSVYSMEEEKYYQEEMENRAMRFKETLDRKLEEVYKQIEASKKIYGRGENVLDEIRRRLKSSSYVEGNSADLHRSGIKHFEEEFSMFYKIPKRSGDFSLTKQKNTLKNLDYDSESRYKSSLKNYGQQSGFEEKSRMYTERPEKSEYNELTKKWGNKRNSNFLGNRQALDYKIESALSNIDNIIETHNLNGNGNF